MGGKPSTFAPNQVIKGWTEAMQLMVEGDKWEMYIPYHLAYGEHGKPPKIPAKATLIFIMELVKIKGTSKPVEDFPEWSPEDLTLWTEKDQAACDQWTEKKVQAFQAGDAKLRHGFQIEPPWTRGPPNSPRRRRTRPSGSGHEMRAARPRPPSSTQNPWRTPTSHLQHRLRQRWTPRRRAQSWTRPSPSSRRTRTR